HTIGDDAAPIGFDADAHVGVHDALDADQDALHSSGPLGSGCARHAGGTSSIAAEPPQEIMLHPNRGLLPSTKMHDFLGTPGLPTVLTGRAAALTDCARHT